MKLEYILIIILALVLGFIIAKLYDKRNSNIIKLLIKRDLLPQAAPGTKWIQNSTCYMGDGTLGVLKGDYCEKISVL
jgi:nucleoside recognition membrane protein YjiH